MIDVDLAHVRVRAEGDGAVVWATIDHPPINLLDRLLIKDLAVLCRAVSADPDARVLVLDSADPEFFLAHADVHDILAIPQERHERGTELNPFHKVVERIRRMPQLTIGVLEGIARGGGSELLLSMDVRFAALETAVLGQPEVALGIIPGGSGTQRIPGLVGRGRALEMILGCDDIDAVTAERWGLVNRALPAAELRAFVERFAPRVASFPFEAVTAAKEAVDAALGDPTEGLLAEADYFNRAWSTGPGRQRIETFLERGGQTREAELHSNTTNPPIW